MKLLTMNRISQTNTIQPADAGREKKTDLPALSRSFIKHLREAGTGFQFIQALSGHNSSMTTTIYTHTTPRGTERIISPLNRLAGEQNAKNNPTQNTEK
jgi:integrase